MEDRCGRSEPEYIDLDRDDGSKLDRRISCVTRDNHCISIDRLHWNSS